MSQSDERAKFFLRLIVREAWRTSLRDNLHQPALRTRLAGWLLRGVVRARGRVRWDLAQRWSRLTVICSLKRAAASTIWAFAFLPS